jgi:hypothetical protein
VPLVQSHYRAPEFLQVGTVFGNQIRASCPIRARPGAQGTAAQAAGSLAVGPPGHSMSTLVAVPVILYDLPLFVAWALP